MAKFNIPEYYIPSLQKLAALSEDKREGFLRALNQAIPTLELGKMKGQIAEKVDIDDEDLLDILRMFGSMYRGRISSDISAQEFADDLNKSLLMNDELPFKDQETNTLDSFTSFIVKVLDADESLGVTAKALDVMTEHEHVYCRARVLTDMRPVFGGEVDKPDAFVTVHTLKLGFHDNAKHKDVYIAMDRNDVRELIGVLERAEKKEKALDAFLKNSNLTHLDVN